MFRSDFFSGNRKRLKAAFPGTAPIVLTANGLLQRSADTSFGFRQDSSFWYLTGCNEPDIILVLDKDKEYFIVPERSHTREVFDGAINDHELKKISGVTEVLDYKTGWKRLQARLKRVKHVATLLPGPAYVQSLGLYVNPARAHLVTELTSHNQTLEFIDIRKQLAGLRMVKQEIELAAIQKAIDITTKTFKAVLKSTNYEFEFEVAADLEAGFRKRGADGVAYQSIVASGKNACTLHYIVNNCALEAKELLLIDAGAEFSNYAADITRTYAFGEPGKRQLAVHEAVLDAQEHAFSLLKPGVVLKDYEQAMEHYLGEKLRELGLIKTIDHKRVRTFCPHATSHFLGLDVHDVADYQRPLEPGMVLTVEPGIYVPKEKIGIRIEDNIVITEKGCKILSSDLPKDISLTTIKTKS
jgi:Xaa-Pro aminopeptidase